MYNFLYWLAIFEIEFVRKKLFPHSGGSVMIHGNGSLGYINFSIII